jgi:uncharacterized membrane protein YhaH (DUF805 family)
MKINYFLIWSLINIVLLGIVIFNFISDNESERVFLVFVILLVSVIFQMTLKYKLLHNNQN